MQSIQSILDEFQHKHKNRMRLDYASELIGNIAKTIYDLPYEKTVELILQLIASETITNNQRSNLEFQLFKYRYFWWADHERL